VKPFVDRLFSIAGSDKPFRQISTKRFTPIDVNLRRLILDENLSDFAIERISATSPLIFYSIFCFTHSFAVKHCAKL